MKTLSVYLFFLTSIFLLSNCSNTKSGNGATYKQNATTDTTINPDLSAYNKATFAVGCFWCSEGIYEHVKGVKEVISGYSGGTKPNPTYEMVSSGKTDYAESIQVYYDSSKISYEDLLKVFFDSEDPTQVNGQGPDIGRQYRSIIFYANSREKDIAEKYIEKVNQSGKYDKPLAVQITPFKKFWQAEDYHQDFVQKNPDNPYVKKVSIPRFLKTQEQIPNLIKPDNSTINK